MDNGWKARLAREAAGLGVPLQPRECDLLAAHADLVLRWNAKVNLTRITAPDEILAKHVLDSLGGLTALPAGPLTVLDMGSGAGYPGIPWLITRADLRLTMVDASSKKVAFLKTALAQLRLSGGRAVHARLAGLPQREGLEPAEVVVSRAFAPLEVVLGRASSYLTRAGAVVAMLGPRESPADAERLAQEHGFHVEQMISFELPNGLGHRSVARLVPRGTPRRD